MCGVPQAVTCAYASAVRSARPHKQSTGGPDTHTVLLRQDRTMRPHLSGRGGLRHVAAPGRACLDGCHGRVGEQAQRRQGQGRAQPRQRAARGLERVNVARREHGTRNAAAASSPADLKGEVRGAGQVQTPGARLLCSRDTPPCTSASFRSRKTTDVTAAHSAGSRTSASRRHSPSRTAPRASARPLPAACATICRYRGCCASAARSGSPAGACGAMCELAFCYVLAKVPACMLTSDASASLHSHYVLGGTPALHLRRQRLRGAQLLMHALYHVRPGLQKNCFQTRAKASTVILTLRVLNTGTRPDAY
jgi:hypothetical protein